MPLQPPEKAYCPSCGVDTEVIVMLAQGDEVKRCGTCGLRLDDIEGPSPPLLTRIVIAEDSTLLREMATDALKENGLAQEVVACRTGEECVEALRRGFQEEKPVNLAILDVHMPGLDGIEAARSLRNMEKEFERPFPVPILFFTVRPCDEDFKKVLNSCHPSAYVNKGVASSPEDLSQRICSVVRKLLATHREGWTQ